MMICTCQRQLMRKNNAHALRCTPKCRGSLFGFAQRTYTAELLSFQIVQNQTLKGWLPQASEQHPKRDPHNYRMPILAHTATVGTSSYPLTHARTVYLGSSLLLLDSRAHHARREGAKGSYSSKASRAKVVLNATAITALPAPSSYQYPSFSCLHKIWCMSLAMS
jgi:hypothetical protein